MAKDLTRYNKKYDENIAAFTEFEATDFIRSLRKDGQLDKAIEVGQAFAANCKTLHSYEKDYGWAIYYKHINVDNDTIKANEDLFNSWVNDVLTMTTQEQYSPYEATINRLVRYELSKSKPDYEKVLDLLNKLDVNQLSKEEHTFKDGKKGESAYERYMRQLAKAQAEVGQYDECLKTIEVAYATIQKFHNRNLFALRQLHVDCQFKAGNHEEALKEYLKLQGPAIDDINEKLYKAYASLNQDQTANAFLLYDLYNKGFSADNASLYENVAKAAKKAEYAKLAELADSLVATLKQEKADGQDHYSGNIYDDMMDELTRHLNKLVARNQGKVTFYNEEKKLGNITSGEDGRVFFVQADYIYDEEVQRYDVVEYTVLPTYDRKKDALSSKAILIEFKYND